MASLVEKLDKVASENADTKMHVVVNFVGVDEPAAKEFGDKMDLKHSVFAVADDKNAERFKVDPKAEFTVMHYRNKTVAANHAFASGQLDDAAIAAVVKSTDAIVGDAAASSSSSKKKKKKKKPKKA